MKTVRYINRAVAFCLVMVVAGAPSAWSMDTGAAAIKTGQQAYSFTLKNPGGTDVKLEDLAGKVIVLSFWECYADSCFAATPAVENMVERYPTDKFTAVSVCSAFPKIFIENGFAKLRQNCDRGQTILLDPEKNAMRRYAVITTPTTFVIGRDGVIWKRVVGLAELRSNDFTELVDSLVNQQ